MPGDKKPEYVFNEDGGDPFRTPATPEELRKAIEDTFSDLGASRYSSWDSGVPVDPTLYPIMDPSKERK